MHTTQTINANGRAGVVFFDDAWDAWGWRTDDFTNGPFDSEEDAAEDLRDELQDA